MDDAFEIHAEGHPDQVVADVSAQVKQAAVGRPGLWPQLVALRDEVCAEVRALQAKPRQPVLGTYRTRQAVPEPQRAAAMETPSGTFDVYESAEPLPVRVEVRATVRARDGERPAEVRVEHRSVAPWEGVTWTRRPTVVGVGSPFPRFPGDTGEV